MIGTLTISQNSHDIQVLAAIRDYFNNLGGKATLKPKYKINNIEEAQASRSVNTFNIRQHDVVIKFLEQYPLRTRKTLDYEDWKSIMIMKKDKLHLTPNGREKMELIKQGMNRGRN